MIGRVVMRNEINATFKKVFGEKENCKTFFSPGRVNLIGEHTDYNGGNVFPCALSFGTYGVVMKSPMIGLITLKV